MSVRAGSAPPASRQAERRCAVGLCGPQGAALAGIAAVYFGLGLSSEQLGYSLVAVTFVYFTDQVRLVPPATTSKVVRSLAAGVLERIAAGLDAPMAPHIYFLYDRLRADFAT